MSPRLLAILVLLPLAACERLGIPDPAKDAADREAEGRAIGSACRQSGRALEDCFTLNLKASKSAIFSGWKEMNDYMTENKIDTVKPELPLPGMPKGKGGDGEAGDAQSDAADDKTLSRTERRRRAEAAKEAESGKDTGKDSAKH
jgi:hypothetical protein